MFLWIIISVTTVALLLSSASSLYLQVNHFRKNILSHVVNLAKIVGDGIQPLLEEKVKGESSNALILHVAETYFDSLETEDEITNVHIYSVDDSNQPAIFFTYNRHGHTPVENKIGSMSRFFQPRFSDNAIEIIRPINSANHTIGYIYLKASADRYNSFIGTTILMHLSVLVIVLTLAILLAIRLVKRVTKPVAQLSAQLKHISRNRDYSQEVASSDIAEISVLSTAINNVLHRIDDFIHKKQDAEEQLRNLNSSLEDMVNQRTNALKDANLELIQTLEKLHQFQRQMVQNEKMASLGDMVAGVAHEVNTPIGLGVTASTMMLDRLTMVQQQFENKTLKASTMAKFLSESEENLNIIYRNLNRAAELISSFKQVAVDQTSENSRPLDVAILINEILLSLRPRLKKVTHNIVVHCEDNLLVETKAGPINQILINLIMNSIIHGFEEVEKGTIDIIAEVENQKKLKITYKDDGKGIPSDIRKRIFDPFVTTKRGQGGSGLGMHLVYNLVTQALNGDISLVSNEGKGVEFIITFPVKVLNETKLKS